MIRITAAAVCLTALFAGAASAADVTTPKNAQPESLTVDHHPARHDKIEHPRSHFGLNWANRDAESIAARPAKRQAALVSYESRA